MSRGRALRGFIFALLGVSACDEGGTPRVAFMDAGEGRDASAGADAGPGDAATEDAGPAVDAGPPIPSVMCGGLICSPHQASLFERILSAGCARDHLDAEVCGLASPDAAVALDASVPPFLPKDAPGAASPSCGAFLEGQLEAPTDSGVDGGDSGYANAQVDVRHSIVPDGQPFEIVHVYPGCCAAPGFCAVDTRQAVAIQMFGQVSYNAGYGCLEPQIFFGPAAAALQPVRCDPQSGLIMPADAGADAGPADAATSDGGPVDASPEAGDR